MSEDSLATMLRKTFKATFDEPRDWQRIEDKMSVGIPDVNAIANGREWWLELKYIRNAPVRKVDLGIRPEQALWLRKRWRCKQNVCVLYKRAWDARHCLLAGRDAFTGSVDLAFFQNLDIKVYRSREEALHALFVEGVTWSDNTLALK